MVNAALSIIIIHMGIFYKIQLKILNVYIKRFCVDDLNCKYFNDGCKYKHTRICHDYISENEANLGVN